MAVQFFCCTAADGKPYVVSADVDHSTRNAVATVAGGGMNAGITSNSSATLTIRD